jgi:PAS domain S-box-containing protein
VREVIKISPSRRKLQLDFSMRWQGALIISIPLFCLLTSVLVMTALRSRTREAVKREAQSQQILLEIHQLSLALSNAQMGVRGYIVGKRQEFLKPYFQAKKALPEALKSLNQQVKSNTQQRQKLQKITSQAQQQISILEKLKTINERQNNSALTGLLVQNESLMNQLNLEINTFREQEKRRQLAYRQKVEQARNLTNIVQWTVLVVSLLGSGGALYLFNELDKKLVERAISLQETSLSLQEIFDNVVDGIIILNERGYIQSANTAVEEIFGYNPEAIRGKHLQRLIAESFVGDSGRVMHFLVGSNQDKLRLQQEIPGLHRDGTIFPMELTVSKMQLNNEHWFIAIVRDITERQQAQEILLKQAQLLDLANDTIMVRDLNDTILYWNQGAERLYGFSVAEALGQSVNVLLKTEFSQPPEQIKKTLFKKGYWNGELVHYRQDGMPITVASGLTLQRNEFGEPVAYLEINQDITQRKISEAALQKSEEQYRTLVKNFPNGAVFLFDEQLRFNIAEGTGLAKINLTSFDLTGKTIWEIFSPEIIAIIEPIYREALQGKATVQQIPLGDRIYLTHVLPITNAEGEILAGMAMTQDITESKKSADALQSRAEELVQLTTVLAQTTAVLEKRNIELDQFAYIVSHDLKAPLRAISNLCQWIEDDNEQNLSQDTRYQLDLMRNRVQRMEALINGLLQYSRVGRLKAELQLINVETILAEIIDSLALPPNTVQILPGIPTLLTERLPLEQVFANLISNAIKHNKREDPQVIISATEQADFYEFAVTDNGLGIAPEFQDKVFIIFQTVGTIDVEENTGIGLAIVKKIVEDRGGTISLESQLGQGATFRFTWSKQIQEGGKK